MFQNEQKKFEACYEKYADMLYRIALSYLKNTEDAEDAVHDAFIKYMHHLFAFRDESHERAWLIRVTVNRCKDLLKHPVHAPLEEAAELVAPQQESAVEHALSGLEELYRIPILLHYLEGFDVREVALILNCSESAVKMRLMRGRNMLKTLIEKEERDV